jgi:hypothetical protein
MNEKVKQLKYTLSQSDSLEGKILNEEIEKIEADYLSNPEKLFEHLEFLAGAYNNTKTEIIIMLNKQISNGIEKLAQKNKWTNLNSVVTHALEMQIKILKECEDVPKFVCEHAEQTLKFKRLTHSEQKIALKMLSDFTDVPKQEKCSVCDGTSPRMTKEGICTICYVKKL